MIDLIDIQPLPKGLQFYPQLTPLDDVLYQIRLGLHPLADPAKEHA